MKTNFIFNRIISEDEKKLLDIVSYDDVINKKKAIIELKHNGFSLLEISYYSEISIILIKRILRCKTPHDFYKLIIKTCNNENAYYSLCIEDQEAFSSFVFLENKDEIRKLIKRGKIMNAEIVLNRHNENTDSFSHKLRRF